MRIRPEMPADYAAIASVHVRAFGNRAAEAAIVALHRQRPHFDPTLALVAEAEGRVVGHALFSPRTVRLLGQDVPAVSLAPIAVEPGYQGRGIGGALIAEGHDIARRKGYQVSFLLGHSSYYPRFGYRMRAFGTSSLTVAVAASVERELTERAPLPEDVVALHTLWRHEEDAVDFALDPGAELLDWISPNPAIESVVYLRGDAIVGYARFHRAEPTRPRVFLARDHDAARAMAGRLVTHASPDAQVVELSLPLHPSSASCMAFGVPECSAWDAAMALSLTRENPLEEYLEAVQRGARPPGRVTWPVEFDLA